MTPLYAYLSQNEISQDRFAKMIGVKQATVSRLARGGATPSLDLAVRIQRVTNGEVPAESWVDDDESTNSEDAA